MRPVLFSIFSLKITSYSFFLVVSFIVGTVWAGFRARKMGLDPDILPDVVFWVFFSSIAGAKFFGILNLIINSNLSNMKINGTTYLIHLIADSGIIAYGGIIGGLLASIIYFRVKKKHLFPMQIVLLPDWD